MKHYILPLLSLLLLASCEKEIEIDYNDIAPRYVIEANAVYSLATVRLSQTRNMNDSTKSRCLEGANITLTTPSGTAIAFAHNDSADSYLPTQPLSSALEGEYQLSVTVEDKEFTATSTVHPTPIVAGVSFIKQAFMEGVEMTFCTFIIMDTPLVANYYRYQLSVNDYASNWTLFKDLGQDGKPMMQLMPIEPLLMATGEELKVGDIITLKVQSIDQGVYDYYYSLGLSSTSAANAISNLSNGALGYFSAHSQTEIILPFTGVNPQ